MGSLFEKRCKPCEGGAQALQPEETVGYMKELAREWRVVDGVRIVREFTFKNFKEAMSFVNKVAALAEEEGHHPDIHIFYNKVGIELWTHAVGGLSDNDFILAAKIDRL